MTYFCVVTIFFEQMFMCVFIAGESTCDRVYMYLQI